MPKVLMEFDWTRADSTTRTFSFRFLFL